MHQGEKAPQKGDAKPVVDCTFMTDFDNHIIVTTDAEAFLFIHDLITSYLKQKEIVLNHQKQTGGLGIKPKEPIITPKEASPAPGSELGGGAVGGLGTTGASKSRVDPLQNDWREFR